jgi:flavin reductase (DIM6/NTAB) family NADH-FMN oxidoreductase RutF
MQSTLAGEQFRRACSRFATGILIATVNDAEGMPHGMTANSFTSVSLNPPLVLFCIDNSCRLLPHFQQATHFGLNVLSAEQQDLSTQFSRRGQDRFADLTWRTGRTGVPLIEATLASFECERRELITAGDHQIVLGEVVACEYHEGAPLIYYHSRYRHIAP